MCPNICYTMQYERVLGKQTNKTMVQVLLFAIHFCLVTNKQFCVNNFMEWNRFYIHTYIKWFHKLYMYTERKKERKSHHSGETPTTSHTGICQITDSSAAGNEKSRQEEKQRNVKSYLTSSLATRNNWRDIFLNEPIAQFGLPFLIMKFQIWGPQ